MDIIMSYGKLALNKKKFFLCTKIHSFYVDFFSLHFLFLSFPLSFILSLHSALLSFTSSFSFSLFKFFSQRSRTQYTP